MHYFEKPKNYQKDWRYAVAMKGHPTFKGELAIVELCETIGSLEQKYKKHSLLCSAIGEEGTEVIPIKIPEGKTYKDVHPEEIETMDNIVLQSFIDVYRSGLFNLND